MTKLKREIDHNEAERILTSPIYMHAYEGVFEDIVSELLNTGTPDESHEAALKLRLLAEVRQKMDNKISVTAVADFNEAQLKKIK